MTLLLSFDPGKATGAALGYYDDTTPYRLVDRWQILGGLDGFMDWLDETKPPADEIVVEKFVLMRNDFVADLSGVPIEGDIARYARGLGVPVIWQTRADKGSLVGYPPTARTNAQKQRVRFNFLRDHGLFMPGTQNDDSNDAVSHGLIRLKRMGHRPTLEHYWPPRND